MTGAHADLLIENVGLLASAASELIPRGWLAVQDDRIAAMGPGDAPVSARRRMDGRGCLAMPGLVNGHTHAAMAFFRGLADDLPLQTWLEGHIFPAEARWVSPEFVYWGTLLACAEMIRAGTTAFADGYFYEEEAARAVETAGLRALLGQGVLDFPTPDSPNPQEALQRFAGLCASLHASSRIRPALFAHSAYACSPDLLRRCLALAEKLGTPLMMHVAETRSETAEVLRRYGQRPVAHLESLGLLSPRLIAIHCVWLTPQEMDLLARRGVKVVHNPESNMKLASGIPPLSGLLARGVKVALGTDGCASNNNLDLFQEMDSAAKLGKLRGLDPTAVPSAAILKMATLGGAEALGMEQEIGSLEPGKKADVILVELNRPHLQPVYNIVSHLVYAASGADVRDVIVNGKLIMRKRRLLTIDEELVLEKAREWGEKIARSNHNFLKS